jgi:hypothetical protein
MTGGRAAYPGGRGSTVNARPFAENRPRPRLLARALAWLAELRGDPPCWRPEAQLAHLRRVMVRDHQALGHHHLARELTERYLAMLGEDWIRHAHEDARTFRRRLGLDPEDPRPIPLPSLGQDPPQD